MRGFSDPFKSALRKPIPAPAKKLLGPLKVVLDIAAWAIALSCATWVRIEMAGSAFNTSALLRTIAFATIAQLGLGYWRGLYRGRWRYGSFDEVAGLSHVAVLAAIAMMAIERPLRPRTPVSAMVVGAAMAMLFMIAARYLWRSTQRFRRRHQRVTQPVTRLLVFGAGDRGCGMIDELLGGKQVAYTPVGLIDDDPGKKRLVVRGVRVLGNRRDIARIAGEQRADALLVAMTDVSPKLMADVLAEAEQCTPPLKVKVLAPIDSLFGERPSPESIRDVAEEDLLGRHRVSTDLAAIAQYIRDKRVLVTGAGGSIGSELCRQLQHYGPSRLVMLDRDESALHGVELSMSGSALLSSPDLVLADLRDRDRITGVLKDIRPHVVFHAAALKHLPLLEANPGEALKSNVWGTQTLLEAAMNVGVERFVNISTDKAADPISVLGFSKRIAERLTAQAGRDSASGTYVSVRFGNVLGSRGSVLTTFRQQIADGRELTVTDPNVTRYFMLVTEAVQLVIQAGAVGRSGEALVLDMGRPVRIAEVAESLIKRSGKDIPIRYTGLRPGEKLHEIRLGTNETDARPNHPLISQVGVPPLDPAFVLDLDGDGDPAALTDILQRLCQPVPGAWPAAAACRAADLAAAPRPADHDTPSRPADHISVEHTGVDARHPERFEEWATAAGWRTA